MYIRLAIWIDYKYAYLPAPDRPKLDASIIGSAEEQKNLLSLIADTFDPISILIFWYIHWNKEKATGTNVTKIINRYAGHEDVLFNRLYKKYIDPEWKTIPLWFSD